VSARRPYVRPMAGWWKRDSFFIVYMAREVTALFVAAYAIVLMFGLLRLSQGADAWNGWLQSMKSPWSLAFHAIFLATFLYHTWSWFRIMPKTMPAIYVGGGKLQPGVITALGILAAVVACEAILLLAIRMQ
jgi:fumarate reductase subunit C